MKKQKVLFVCIHNSARSIMAAEFLNELCGDLYEAESAGLEPGKLNPLVVEAMREIGKDVSGYQPRAVFDVIKNGSLFSHVIAVCDGASAERCPIVPGVTQRLNWPFPDPSALQGSWDERLEGTRRIRDEIKAHIQREFCTVNCG